MPEPQTEAAQRLLGDLLGRYGWSVTDPVSDELTRAALAAIEAEARDAALAEAEAAVRDAAPRFTYRIPGIAVSSGKASGRLPDMEGEAVGLDAALAAIAALRSGGAG